MIISWCLKGFTEWNSCKHQLDGKAWQGYLGLSHYTNESSLTVTATLLSLKSGSVKYDCTWGNFSTERCITIKEGMAVIFQGCYLYSFKTRKRDFMKEMLTSKTKRSITPHNERTKHGTSNTVASYNAFLFKDERYTNLNIFTRFPSTTWNRAHRPLDGYPHPTELYMQ